MARCKYTLKAGANITWDNMFYNNTNLTDEVAEAFVAKFPTTKFFAVKPEVVETVEVEAAEAGVEGIDAPELGNLEGMTAEESKKEKERKADAARRERERAAKAAAQTELS